MTDHNYNYNQQTTDNQEELFWEVSENDEVIGSVPRKVAHNETRKPWHRSVHIYLFNNNGDIFFSQRSLTKDTAPGEWTVSSGGHVKYGQSYEETAQREIEEELGVSVPLTLLTKCTIAYDTEREIIAIFVGTCNQTFHFDPTEVAQVKAFNFDQVVADFLAKKFTLSRGSNNTFTKLIETGELQRYREEMMKKMISFSKEDLSINLATIREPV